MEDFSKNLLEQFTEVINYSSSSSTNSTSISPKKSRYLKDKLSDFICCVYPEDQEAIELHTPKQLSKFPTEYGLLHMPLKSQSTFYKA